MFDGAGDSLGQEAGGVSGEVVAWLETAGAQVSHNRSGEGSGAAQSCLRIASMFANRRALHCSGTRVR